MTTYRIQAMTECLAPLTHMMGTAGNEALINREAIILDGNVRHVPVISGNTLRHRAIREPGALYLVDRLGLGGALTLEQLNFMFYGGTLSQSSVMENWRTVEAMQRIFPLYRLLGGALRNQIISGSLNVGRGVLVCEENKKALNEVLPVDMRIDGHLLGAEAFVGRYQYTRGDAAKLRHVKPVRTDDDAGSHLMIFSGESVRVHALFYSEFHLLNVGFLELGAFLHSLNGWHATHPTVGGQSARGHGLIKMRLRVAGESIDMQSAISGYADHVEAHREEAIEWLMKAFEKKPKKAKAEKTAS